MKAKEQVMKMKAENEVEPEDEPLSFSAGLGANFTRNAENHGIVVYDQIQLVSRSALPGGYNPETGIFVAPKDGESYHLYFCVRFGPFGVEMNLNYQSG